MASLKVLEGVKISLWTHLIRLDVSVERAADTVYFAMICKVKCSVPVNSANETFSAFLF